MRKDPNLETYWITFPSDSHLPLGIGVTAYSSEDAFSLIEDQGFDEWYVGAREISVTPGITIENLDPNNVVPNIGPMQFRGVWYPAANIGFGAPRDRAIKPISISREHVYTVTDYWDGPRGGIADFNGEPHVYECVFSDEDDDWTNIFRLQPVSSEVLALALEDWDIFLRWETAFQEGKVAQSTHPALPDDKARSDELAIILGPNLAVQPDCALVSRGRFQAESPGWNNFVVTWYLL